MRTLLSAFLVLLVVGSAPYYGYNSRTYTYPLPNYYGLRGHYDSQYYGLKGAYNSQWWGNYGPYDSGPYNYNSHK